MSLESNFTISQRADTSIRRAATVVLLIVGISSAILSYAGLRHLAIMAGIADSLSFLFPIVVDGMILLGSLSVLRAALARMPTWFGWMLTILGTATSIAGNILSVENANLVSQIIHSVPPVFLCLSLETFIQLLRHRIKNTYDATDNRVSFSPAPQLAVPRPERTVRPNQNEEVEKDIVGENAAMTRPETAPSEPTATSTAVTSPVVTPPVVTPQVPESITPVMVHVPVAVDIPRKDAAVDSKALKSTPAPAAPVAARKSVEPQPKPARAQPSATTAETVERYRIILENLDNELTKTQRIAEILRVYPDARIGDLREALGDEPTLRIDGSVRRAKELLKSGK